MKKILLPTDFSDNSWNAITYALQLFKDVECTFYLLNTYMPRIYYLEYMQAGSAHFSLLDSMKEASVKGLEEIEEKIQSKFKDPKHTFFQISAINTLSAVVNELQKGRGIDFIIMGTKGASGIREVLFGSNTVHIIKNAECPVLAIPEKFVFETPLEILFPSDYEVNFQNNHIKLLKEIASTYHSRINVLNVSYGHDLTEVQVKNKKKLETYFKDVSHLFHSVSSENVIDAIAHFQLKTRINFLTMIRNKHTFFENLFFKPTINQIGHHLNLPFLVIPSKI